MISKIVLLLALCPALLCVPAGSQSTEDNIAHVGFIAQEAIDPVTVPSTTTTSTPSPTEPASPAESSAVANNADELGPTPSGEGTMEDVVAVKDEDGQSDFQIMDSSEEKKAEDVKSANGSLTTAVPALLPSAAGSSSSASRVSACLVLVFLICVSLLLRP